MGAAIALAAARTAAAAREEMIAQGATMQLPSLKLPVGEASDREPLPPIETPLRPRSAPAASARPPERPLRAGEEIAQRFVVLAPRGSASFGAHYRAKEGASGKLLSVWTARVTGPAAAAGVAAGKAAERLEHRNIARTFTVFQEGDRLIALTEPIEGDTLAEYVAQRAAGNRLPVQSAVNVILQIASALGHAHEATAHGAMGLDAVVVLPGGRLKIVGFGLGAAVSGGEPTASPSADVRALARMLYQLLTGTIWTPDAPPLAEVRPDVAVGIDTILKRALTAEPPSAMEFHRGLAMAVGAKPLSRGDEVPALRPVEDEAAEGRWLVVRGHLDYGPFSLDQLRAEIAHGRLSEDSILKQVPSGTRRAARELPVLVRLLDAQRKKQAEERERREKERRDQQRRRRRMARGAVNVLLAVVVAAGLTWLLAWRMQTPDEVVREVARLRVEPSARADALVTLPAIPRAADAGDKSERRGPRKRARRGGEEVTPPTTAPSVPAAGETQSDLPPPPPVPETPPPPAEVDFSESSPLDVAAREAAKAAVRRSTGQIRPCFDREVRRTPGLRGEYRVSFAVATTGKAYGVRVRGEGEISSLQDCVRGTLAATTFPVFTGTPLEVELPFSISGQ